MGGVANEEAAQVMFAEARARQPELTAPFEPFRSRLAVLLAEGLEVSAERADDLLLACACAEGQAAALQRFEQQLMPGARAAMSRVTADANLVDEAAQELRERLFLGEAPRIGAFSGRGPLWKWLRITATRTAHDVLRARTDPLDRAVAEATAVERLLLECGEGEPEFRLVRVRYQSLFREVFAEAVAALTTEERTLLRLRYLENQGIDRLAIPFRAHRATMARRLQSIREKLLAEVQQGLQARDPRLRDEDLQSVWRAVKSHIHCSFSRLLQE